MGDIREEMLRTQALQDMELNAEITDITCKIDYLFSWEGKVSNLFTGVNISPYNSMYGEWPISEEKVEQYINDQIKPVEIIKKKHIEENEINKVRKYKDISSNIFLDVTLYYKISYIDDESVWAYENIKITKDNFYSNLLSYVKPITDKKIYSEVSNDKINVYFDTQNVTLTCTNEPYMNMNNLEGFLLQYLSEPNKWTKGEIGQINTTDDKLFIPIFINNKCMELEFNNPEDNKNPIWEFANEFNYKDPWNLEKEDIEISLGSITDNLYYQHNLFNVRKPRKNKLKGIKSKICKILS